MNYYVVNVAALAVGENTKMTFKDYVEYAVAIVLWKFVAPFLIATGTIGSILSLVVLARSSLTSSTTIIYLTVLALADVVVLATGLLRYWVTYTFDYDVRVMSDFSCKLHTFVVYLSLDYATWILVALTIDRLIHVCVPFRASRLCTPKRAKYSATIMLLLLITVNMHYFWTYAIVEKTIFGTGVDCYVSNPTYMTFIERVWPWLDFAVVCFIPFTIMIICNILIIKQLILSSRKLKKHHEIELSHAKHLHEDIDTTTDQNRGHNRSGQTVEVANRTQTTSDQNKPTDIIHLETVSEHCSNPDKSCKEENTDNAQQNKSMGDIRYEPDKNYIDGSRRPKINKKNRGRISSLTVMLLTVNCLFLLLTSPIVVYLIGFSSWKETPSPQEEARLMLGWAVVNMLQYTNNAIHFFLYCLTVPSFRRTIFKLLPCKHMRRIHPSISITVDLYK